MDPRTLVRPRRTEIVGGLVVRRALPAAAQRAVGPFVFFDHFGPVEAGPDDDHDVPPHPHIGLATLTYLFEGAMQHRDSTGAVQRIEPGAVNWMSAGRGVVHSERTPDELRGRARRSHGLQLWLALPPALQESAPNFQHTPAEALAPLVVGGARLRVLAGSAFGITSPVRTASPTLLIDAEMSAGDAFPVPLAAERAAYGVDGGFTLDGAQVPAQTLVLLHPDEEPLLAADVDVRVVLIGGEPLGPRFIWWNFVAETRERIDRAADDWAAGRFTPVPGESAGVPLPPRQR